MRSPHMKTILCVFSRCWRRLRPGLILCVFLITSFLTFPETRRHPLFRVLPQPGRFGAYRWKDFLILLLHPSRHNPNPFSPISRLLLRCLRPLHPRILPKTSRLLPLGCLLPPIPRLLPRPRQANPALHPLLTNPLRHPALPPTNNCAPCR